MLPARCCNLRTRPSRAAAVSDRQRGYSDPAPAPTHAQSLGRRGYKPRKGTPQRDPPKAAERKAGTRSSDREGDGDGELGIDDLAEWQAGLQDADARPLAHQPLSTYTRQVSGTPAQAGAQGGRGRGRGTAPLPSSSSRALPEGEWNYNSLLDYSLTSEEAGGPDSDDEDDPNAGFLGEEDGRDTVEEELEQVVSSYMENPSGYLAGASDQSNTSAGASKTTGHQMLRLLARKASNQALPLPLPRL